MANLELAEQLLLLLSKDQEDLKQYQKGEFSLEEINRAIRARTEEARAILKTVFPTKRLVGTAAYTAFIVLILHSDDPKLMNSVAQTILSLNAEDADRAHAAYLIDKILLREGKPQRYGTQYNPTVNGSSVTFLSTEDLDSLDTRRAEMNLPPILEYEETIRKNLRK